MNCIAGVHSKDLIKLADKFYNNTKSTLKLNRRRRRFVSAGSLTIRGVGIWNKGEDRDEEEEERRRGVQLQLSLQPGM